MPEPDDDLNLEDEFAEDEPETQAEEAGPEAIGESVPEPMGWSQVWQLPALLLGVGLLALSVYLALPEEVDHDLAAALDSARDYLVAENLDEAEKLLAEIEQVAPQSATAVERARIDQYNGDLLYQHLRSSTPIQVDTEQTRATWRRIIGHYRDAEQLGQPLTMGTLRRLTHAYAALGRESDALTIIDRMTEAPVEQRLEQVRRLIERRMANETARREAAMVSLINRYREEARQELDTAQRRAAEVWVTSVEAELLLETGDALAAIDFLLRHYQRLMATGGDEDLAPIIIKLARAYQSKSPPEFERADRLYRFAQQRIDESDPLNAEIHLRLGEIALIEGGPDALQTAMASFSTVIREFPSEPVFVDALIGRGDVEARMGAYPEALEILGQAVAWLADYGQPYDPRRTQLVDVVRSHVDYLADLDEYDTVLDFLMLMAPLYGEVMPAPIVLDLAVTHERIGEQQRAYAESLDPYADTLTAGPTPDAARLANQKAAQHFANAAANYHQHARLVTISDNQAHGVSLWRAGICYDRAQLWTEAISVYAEYVDTRPEDARRHQAMARLGRSLMAAGEYQAAIDQFLNLSEQHPTGFQTFGVLVPLAQAYTAVGSNDAALRTLRSVLEDHEAITPESDQYREALIELGSLYYRLGEDEPDHYVDAIEHLEAAVDRYGSSLDGARLRYLLADSYRKSVIALEEDLGPVTQREKVAQYAERDRRLEAAQNLYNMVIEDLESRVDQVLSPIERLYLRNAYFYQADCAFDRRQFETAIALYGEAARRWENHPASLVALVQIFNARCELGQFQEARVANDQARWQLERMPDDAFDDPSLPMTREHWEDWLRWTSELELLGGQASVR
ncbi:MAG: tetratricopeptide repeat protein [Phycisphaeraceae bacterium]